MRRYEIKREVVKADNDYSDKFGYQGQKNFTIAYFLLAIQEVDEKDQRILIRWFERDFWDIPKEAL